MSPEPLMWFIKPKPLLCIQKVWSFSLNAIKILYAFLAFLILLAYPAHHSLLCFSGFLTILFESKWLYSTKYNSNYDG